MFNTEQAKRQGKGDGRVRYSHFEYMQSAQPIS